MIKRLINFLKRIILWDIVVTYIAQKVSWKEISEEDRESVLAILMNSYQDILSKAVNEDDKYLERAKWVVSVYHALKQQHILLINKRKKKEIL